MTKRIALLGAESTGKTALSHALAAHYRAQNLTVEVVPEVLREWCTREQRPPRPQEQLPIAQDQEGRVDEAAGRADMVIADTTALMVAVYSGMLFADGALYRFALERQTIYDVTLLAGLDLPWVADGLQRQGPQVREPVDALVRQLLQQAGVPYRVVYGSGDERLRGALAAIDAGSIERPSRDWVSDCEKCSDPDCEHKLFSRLLPQGEP